MLPRGHARAPVGETAFAGGLSAGLGLPEPDAERDGPEERRDGRVRRFGNRVFQGTRGDLRTTVRGSRAESIRPPSPLTVRHLPARLPPYRAYRSRLLRRTKRRRTAWTTWTVILRPMTFGAFKDGDVREQFGSNRRMGHPRTVAPINPDDRFIAEGAVPEMRDRKRQRRFLFPTQ